MTLTTATTIPLWPDGAPGADVPMPTELNGIGWEDGSVSVPTLTVFLPPAETANGTAVVICPGGGYGGLATGHEGVQIAAWLNARGIAGFMLRYRLAPHRHPIPLQDAQRAIRTVRARASEWLVNPARIGIWGFSAGGHLASTACTHFDAGQPEDADPIQRAGCRPDFAVLAYPVICMDPPYAHLGSRYNLLGEDADPATVASVSSERQVTPDTPPTFLFHTDTDTAVPPENSALYYLALRRAGVPSELHIYADGPHGIGLKLDDPILGTWGERLAGWLTVRGLLGKS